MKKLTIEQCNFLLQEIGRRRKFYDVSLETLAAFDSVIMLIESVTENFATYVDVPDQNGEIVRVWTQERDC